MIKSTYNLFGDRLSVQQPDTLFNGTTHSGVLTAYSYDHLGHLTSTTIGAPVQVYKVTNGGKEFIWSATATQQLVQRFTYDELGRQIRNTGTDGVSTVLEYDLDGNVIATATQEVAGQSELLYRTVNVFDAQHQKIATRNANKDTMSWVYDHGRLVSMVDMGGVQTSYGYDQSGRLVTQTSGRGQDLRYTFTGANLTRIEDAATKLTTDYTYDANGNRLSERQKYTGTPGAGEPPRLQNNTLRYDEQNRLVGIKDDVYTLTYEYDKNGNRTRITTQYGTTTLQSYNAYDVMNRQTVVNGDWDASTGKAVFGQHGHAITYDKSGNRITDTFKGVAVSVTGGFYGTTKDQATTEYYTYDGVGRLESIRRDVLTIDVRRYDAAGRITQSGLLASTLPGTNGRDGFGGVIVSAMGKDRFAATLKELGITAAGRVYSYDVGGHITRQQDLNAELKRTLDTYFVKDEWNPKAGYDAMGNLIGYTVVIPNTNRSYNGRYLVEYEKYDTYKESRTILASSDKANISKYDQNGNRVSIIEGVIERIVTDPGTTTEVDGAITTVGLKFEERIRETDKVLNRLWYDADGHIQSHTADGKTEFNLIVNGQVYGAETQTNDNILGSNYLGVTSPTLTAAPSSYSVQSTNETLQGIAQSLWGDANLWYLIADANALSADAKLTPGQVLRIPERVNTVHGDYGTYKPYDPTEQIGSTAPVMPAPHGGKGCGGLGIIVTVIVAVAVTAMTGVYLGPSLLNYAIAGAAGSVASQTVGMAIGVQDGFNWKAVGSAALSNMITLGIDGISTPGKALAAIGGKSIPAAMARAALSSAVTQSITVATGLQDHFSWRNVAASAVGAGVGAQVGDMLAQNEVFSGFLNGTALKVARGTVAGFAAGTATAIARGGKVQVVQIAADAFGNALGSSFADRMSTPNATSADKGFSDNVRAWRDNPFEGPTRNSYAFNRETQTADYLEKLETIDVRNLKQNDGTFAESIIPRISWDIDTSIPTVLVPHAKMTFEEMVAYDLRTPESARGEFANDFGRGFRGTRNVFELETSGEVLGRQAAAIVNFGKGMIGVTSFNNSRSEWKQGNYGTSVVHGMAAIGEAGSALLSFGLAGMVRQSGKIAAVDSLAANGANRLPLSFEDSLVVRGDASRAQIVQTIGDAAQPSLQSILRLDPNARIGFRGSLVDGLKNETKLGANRERVAFDGTVATKDGKPYTSPQGYDADFFVVSDDLAAQFSKKTFFKDITKLDGSLKGTFQEFGNAMQSNPILGGMKTELPSFRVYTTAEMTKKSGSQYYFLHGGK